jgi:hypothetical protein
MPCALDLDSTLIRALADPPSRHALHSLAPQLARRWWHTRCDPLRI